MKYQLVIQFDVLSEREFDFLVEFEARLVDRLKGDSEVDGHDFGTGEMNVFIYTDQPERTVVLVKLLASEMKPKLPMRIAYRAANGRDYTVLWPPGLTEFRIA